MLDAARSRGLSGAEAALIGRLWLRGALFEHASIASFASFILQSMQVGAPPDILQRTIRAMEDELDHARICFRLAARFLGVSSGPGPFEAPLSQGRPADEAAILTAVIEEGCIGETVAVSYAAEALLRSEDDEVSRALRKIVADERGHCDLAWDFAEWLVTARPQLLPAARAAFERGLRGASGSEDPADWSDRAEGFGHLSSRSQRAVRARTIEEELIPRARLLFDRQAPPLYAA